MILEVQMRRVEAVGDRRAARAAFVPIGVEHEVIHEQLRPAEEQAGNRGLTALGVEAVVLVEANPRQLPSPASEVVVEAGQLLLGPEALEPSGAPPFPRFRLLFRHCFFPFHSVLVLNSLPPQPHMIWPPYPPLSLPP